MAAKGEKPSKLGRKGDPRMHRAVAERLANPDLSLLEALRRGGFDFPLEGGHDATLTDTDGVTLGQRKNQLSRRLRLARQSMEGGSKSTNRIVASAQSRISGTKRGAALLTVSDEGEEHQEEELEMNDDVSKMAKFHPNYHPLFPAVRPGASALGTTPEAGAPGSYGPTYASKVANAGLAASRQPLLGSHPSGVAVASLISTANSVGLTLEQLAMSLSSTPNLLRTLSSQPNSEARLLLALNLYRTDCRALLQKCMLLAGYEGSQVTEGSPTYMDVALKAWELEGKRLEYFLGCHSESKAEKSIAQGNVLCDCLPGVGTVAGELLRRSAGAQSSDSEPGGKHDDSDENGNKTSIVLDDDDESQTRAHSCGRHMHRLAGKCGHKAILHQPPGRPAHIDFVVDGKVECYEGIQPAGPRGQGAFWPSRYKCIELACPTDPVDQKQVACGSEECEAESDPLPVPKELPLSTVDFDGKDWNVDFFNHSGRDDTLIGLIKLGEGDKPNSS